MQSGEFDLEEIGEEVVQREAAAGVVPATRAVHTDATQARRQLVCARAEKHLHAALEAWLLDWAERLKANSGLKAICQVSEGFKLRGATVEPHANRHHMWQSLAQILQQSDEIRQRILYYRSVVEWMACPDVDV